MDSAPVPLPAPTIRPVGATGPALHSSESILVVCGLIAVATTIAFSLLATIGTTTL